MNTIQTVLLKTSVFILLLLLCLPTFAAATNYKQPAFISNFYFTYKSAQKEKGVQPDLIINAITASIPQTAVQLVIDLAGNKGAHNIEIEILNMEGKPVTGTLKFAPFNSPADDMHFKITTNLEGNFPEGGIFFKVYDTLDKGPKALIGIFRMMTVK